MMRKGSMVSGNILAFLAHPDSLGRIPDTSRVLPLSPRVRVNRARLVAPRPEDLLSDEDFRSIDEAARKVASDWWKAAPDGTYLWRGINVGECFSYDLRFVARDVLKADLVAKRAIEQSSADSLVTDVPPISGSFPPYPYLVGIGSILEEFASASGFPFRRLYVAETPQERIRRRLILRAYGLLASRKALFHLRSGHPIVGVGPFPETYGPVAAARSAGDGVMVVVSSLTAPLRADPSRGLYFAPFDSFLTSGEREEIRSFITGCVKSIPTAPSRHTPYPGSKQSESVFLVDLRRRLQERLGDVAGLCVAFEKGLGRASRLLLLETHSPVSKAAVKCGRQRAIPLVVIQHGVIADPESYVETDADDIAAWGPLDAAWFSSHLPARVRVSPTGNPRYDSLTTAPRPSTNPALQHIPRGLRAVLFASAPFGHLRSADSLWDHEALHAVVVEAVGGVQEAFLLFKRHPAERPGASPPGSHADQGRSREVVGGDTFGLIRASELVITIGSSVAIEAMYLGRSVVFLGLPNPESPFHPPEDGAGLRVRTAEELEGQVRRLLREPDFRDRVLQGQRDYLQRCFAPLDGKASIRVAAFLR